MPTIRKKKRKIGFLARSKYRGGKRILLRRRRKGRKRLTN
jgi:ribosomal protein L34